MMRQGIGLVLCFLATLTATDAAKAQAAGAAAAAGHAPRRELPTEGVITNPDWIKKPDGNDVGRFYPELASMLELSGHARINCTVTDLGALSDCSTLAETPTGFGFGQAGIQMSTLFRMKPRTLDGVPVGGARIIVPLSFIPDAGTAESEPVETTPAPSAKALALGRRVAAASMDDSLNAAIKTSFQQMRDRYATAGVSQEQQIAIDEFERAMIATVPLRLERVARFYAESIPEPELSKISSFLESPAGKSWIAHSSEMQIVEIKAARGLQEIGVKDAREHLCRQITCLSKDTPVPSPKEPGVKASSPPAPSTRND
jgi:hypothetical protein